MSRNATRRFAALSLAFTASCGLFGDEDPAVTISAAPSVAILQQSGSAAITVEIARTNFDQPVTLAVDGALPTGVTAAFSQNPVPAGTNTTTLTLTASGTATPGNASVAIKATAEGLADQTLPLEITVNVRGSHTVALSSSAITVAQGGGGQATVLLARQSNNAGSVTLTSSGAPSGMTVTFGESPTTTAASSMTVAATAEVAPGTYDVSVTGTQPGVTPTPAAVTLVVTVIAAPSTTSVTMPFCADDMPTWFAYQNDGFLWQRVTPSGTSFNFDATSKLAVAFAFVSGSASDVRFYYATRAELAGINANDCFGPKSHSGTTTNVTASQTAIVSMGSAFDIAASNAFVLDGVADRPLDLVATRGLVSAGVLTPDRMVIRRGVNLASGAAIPVIDFLGAESAAPATNTLTVTGLEAGETMYAENVFRATTSTSGLVFSTEGASGTVTMHSAPAAQIVAGDVHELFIDAFNSAGTVAHTMVSYFSAPGDRSETLGPLLTNPTVTVAASLPYVRERGQLASQTAYQTAARFVFLQGQQPSTKFVVVVVTAGHLGAVPVTWDVTVPDLSGVTGFSSSWMHSAGQTTAYSAEAFAARAEVLFGGAPAVGETVKFAFRQSTVATSVGSALRAAAARAPMAPRRGTLNPPPQYLRR